MNYPKTVLLALAALAVVGPTTHAAVVVNSGSGTYSYSSSTGVLDSNATNVNVTPFNLGFASGDRYSVRDNGGFGSPSASSITYDFNAPIGFEFQSANVFYRDQSNGGPSFSVTAAYSLNGGVFTTLTTDTNQSLTSNGPTSLAIAPGTIQVTFRISGVRDDSDPGRLSYFGMGDSIFSPSTLSPGFVFNSTTVAIPEPASVTLLGLGLGTVLFFRRRRMTVLS